MTFPMGLVFDLLHAWWHGGVFDVSSIWAFEWQMINEAWRKTSFKKLVFLLWIGNFRHPFVGNTWFCTEKCKVFMLDMKLKIQLDYLAASYRPIGIIKLGQSWKSQQTLLWAMPAGSRMHPLTWMTRRCRLCQKCKKGICAVGVRTQKIVK